LVKNCVLQKVSNPINTNTCSLESNKLNVFYREVSRNNRHGKCDIYMIS